MNIIEDALGAFDTVSRLTKGSQPLRSIKINETAEECVTISEQGRSVFCVHGRDVIEVRNARLDQTMNTILEASRSYELWERDLNHMIFNGCSLQDIVDAAFPMFHNPIFFIDETDKVLARTGHLEGSVNEAWDCILSTGYMPYESATLAFNKLKANQQALRRRGKNIPFIFSPPSQDIDNRGINYRIYSPKNGEIVGTMIIIENETPVTLGMLNLSEILSDAVDAWMNMHKQDHPFRNDRDLIRDLIENPEQVEHRQVIQRYIPESVNGYEMAVITGCENLPIDKISAAITEKLEGSRSYRYGDEILSVIPLSQTEEEIKTKLTDILYYDGIRIGLSYPFFDLTVLGNYYHQAKIALSYSKDKVSGIQPEIAMRYFTSEVSKGYFGSNMAHPALEKLKEYDEKHGGELYETLYQFLRHERSLIESAKALNIHRNSLIYRVEKIRQLTDIDLDDPDIREYILLSYRI